MTDVTLVPAGANRAVVTGLHLPTPPPARIYISGLEYQVRSPRAVLPPLINTAKIILNWAGPANKIAKNVFYILKGTGSGATSDPNWLQALATAIKTAVSTSSLMSSVHTSWSLQSVTARDNGGTSASANDTSAALSGAGSGSCHPPQVAVAISWSIAEVYRGGKPRLYLPGIPTTAVSVSGDSQLTASYATALDTSATAFLSNVNAGTVLSTAVTMGTVSHYSGHAIRPTPTWRSYLGVHIHERLDSQRRRSGREAQFPVTP